MLESALNDHSAAPVHIELRLSAPTSGGASTSAGSAVQRLVFGSYNALTSGRGPGPLQLKQVRWSPRTNTSVPVQNASCTFGIAPVVVARAVHLFVLVS